MARGGPLGGVIDHLLRGFVCLLPALVAGLQPVDEGLIRLLLTLQPLLVLLLVATALLSFVWTPYSPYELDIPAKLDDGPLGQPSQRHRGASCEIVPQPKHASQLGVRSELEGAETA